MAKNKKDKHKKALEAIEKSIRKAAGKGVTVEAIHDTVAKAVAAATAEENPSQAGKGAQGSQEGR